jgi:hypothetical protein
MPSREDLDRIEHDIAEVRRDAGATLAALEERLSPGGLVDAALRLARDSDIGRQVRASVSDNVGPLLLIAAGLGWWAFNLSRRSEMVEWDERRYGPSTSPYAPTPAGLDPLVLPDEVPHEHHVHVSRSDPNAPAGRSPSPEELLGTHPAQKSAAESARAFRTDQRR